MSERRRGDGKEAEEEEREMRRRCGWGGERARGGDGGVGGAGTWLETSKIQIKQTNRWMWRISIHQQQTGAPRSVSRRVSWQGSRVNRAED